MNIKKDLIKEGSRNRPQSENSCRYITVHDTGNKGKGATASAHAKYIKNIKDLTSWHYTVDDSEIYQHIPDEEKSYHTSDKFANENSVSVELCVNSDGDFEKTLENAAWLIKQLKKNHGISDENIRRHYDWTGKQCPASLSESDWRAFLAKCKNGEGESISVVKLREMGYTSITL